ncbi:MAG: rhomboid family intramembrane serine protease [Bacteroidia bacterium]
MNADQKSIFKSFIPPFIFVLILWIVKFFEIILETNFAEYGVFPRHTEGLIGIISAPLIHADFEHLTSNSIPMLILGATLIYFYKELALKVFILDYLLSGFWLWIIGRENYHIGASGVLYGLVTFLFFSGVFRKHTGLMALSLLVVFLYGSLVWGIFPLYKVISWESHLCGSLAGILLAFVYRKEGPQRKVYEWELEGEGESANDNEIGKVSEGESENNDSEISPEEKEEVRIRYIYKKENPENNKGEL